MLLSPSLTRVVLLTIIACVVLPLRAQEKHWSADPANALYKRSAFAHGYIHGYEMGYHTGDFDYQMSRSPRELRKVKEYREAKLHYSPEFGSRDHFVNGYENGFRVGYADAYSGRDFRAAKESRTLANEVGRADSGDLRPDGNFDEGFSNGYRLGIKTGLEHARSESQFASRTNSCDAKSDIKRDAENPYCKAFGMGYELGYSDGYTNQRAPNQSLRTAVGDK